MLTLGLTGRIWVCLQPQDGRKGIDGLAAVVTTHLARDPLNGDLFVFRNRRGDRLKLSPPLDSDVQTFAHPGGHVFGGGVAAINSVEHRHAVAPRVGRPVARQVG